MIWFGEIRRLIRRLGREFVFCPFIVCRFYFFVWSRLMIHGLLEILFRVLKDQMDFVLGKMILWVKFVCFYSDVIV